MVIVALCFWSVQLCDIQDDQNTLIKQSILQNMVTENTLPSSPSSTLKSLLWSGREVMINARDPMQNPGQTWIFHELGQTHLTRTKHDPVDLDNPDDLTQFQSWCKLCTYLISYLFENCLWTIRSPLHKLIPSCFINKIAYISHASKQMMT